MAATLYPLRKKQAHSRCSTWTNNPDNNRSVRPRKSPILVASTLTTQFTLRENMDSAWLLPLNKMRYQEDLWGVMSTLKRSPWAWILHNKTLLDNEKMKCREVRARGLICTQSWTVFLGTTMKPGVKSKQKERSSFKKWRTNTRLWDFLANMLR